MIAILLMGLDGRAFNERPVVMVARPLQRPHQIQGIVQQPRKIIE